MAAAAAVVGFLGWLRRFVGDDVDVVEGESSASFLGRPTRRLRGGSSLWEGWVC